MSIYLHPVVIGSPFAVRLIEQKTGHVAYVVGSRVELRPAHGSLSRAPMHRRKQRPMRGDYPPPTGGAA